MHNHPYVSEAHEGKPWFEWCVLGVVAVITLLVAFGYTMAATVILAVTAIIIHKELAYPLDVFRVLMESLSVILQVNYAKWGNRKGLKLRVFKRAPIHDTFRVRPGQLAPDVKVLCNWPKGCWLESKVTVRFWIITIILAAMTIITLKIR
mgnify:FL=1